MTTTTDWETRLKEEAREDLENERFGWMEFDKASGSRFLNTDKVEAFLDTLIDKALQTQKEEIRGALVRAIEMGRVSGNFDVLLHSVTEYYLALEDTTETAN